MSGNDQYLYERLVQSRHQFEGAVTTQGVKIWSSNGRFPLNTTKRSVLGVNWNGFFSPGCNPIVSATLGRRDRNRCYVSVKGPGSENWPNARGCEIHALMDPDTPSNYTFSIYMPIHIIAIGY